jgi:hypothetical protein
MAESLLVDGAKIDLKGFDCLAVAVKVSVLVLGRRTAFFEDLILKEFQLPGRPVTVRREVAGYIPGQHWDPVYVHNLSGTNFAQELN